MTYHDYSHEKSRNGLPILVILVFGFLLLCGCASEMPKTYHVGIMVGAETMGPMIDPFKARMADFGFIEGKNVVYDVQRSKGDPTEEKRIAEKFLFDKVDLVMAFPGQSARAVKASLQGTNIPIVFANAVIEGTDLVESVRNPGGNITGVRVPGTEEVLKCFESLLEFTPRFERIMIIYDPNYPTNSAVIEALRAQALSANITLQEVRVNRVSDVQIALLDLEKNIGANMNAILLLPDTITRSTEATDLIMKFADAHRALVAGGPDTLVRNGAVLSATTNIVEVGEAAASLVDKIFKGIPAGTIPVISPVPHLYINNRKAQDLGLVIPQGLLKQAAEIIR